MIAIKYYELDSTPFSALKIHIESYFLSLAPNVDTLENMIIALNCSCAVDVNLSNIIRAIKAWLELVGLI